MRLGQIKQLFFALHQTDAGQSARGNRNQRLNNVEALALGIGIRIHERQDAITAIGYVEDQEIEWQQRGEQAVAEILQVQSGHKQNAGGDGRTSNRSSQVRLEHNQPEKNRSWNNRRNQRVPPVVHGFRPVLQEESQE